METIYPSLEEVIELHRRSIARYGGSEGIRDIGLVESALLGAQQTFGGVLLYRTLSDQAAALWHGLVCNHGFVDGNKRIGLITTSVFLRMNGCKLEMSQDMAEEVTLKLASGELNRQELMALLVDRIATL